MIKLLKYFKWYYWLIAVAIVAVVVGQVQLDLILPEYMGEIVNVATMPNGSLAAIWESGWKMLLCSLGSVACTILASFMASRLAAGFSQIVRKKIFDKVESFSLDEINKFSTSSLITRCTNDVQQIQMLITMGLRLMVTAPVMAIGALTKMTVKSADLTWVSIGGIALIVMFVLLMYFTVVPKFKIIQKLTDKLNNVTRENLTGLRVVRAYNAEKYEEEKFNDVNVTITKTNLFVNRIIVLMQPLMQVVMNGMSLAIVWWGAYLIAGGNLDLGTMSEFTMYSMQVVMSFMMLTMIFIFVPRASVSANRINAVLNTENSIVEISGESPTTDVKGELEFKNVSFKYSDGEECVLSNINFKATKGQTIAIIGSTGSGKSTLLNLIPRFYDATEGQVLVDGIDVKDYKLSDLHDKLGYVPQKAILFSGTLESNLKFGAPNATREDMELAIDIAQAKNIVERKGFEGNIAQGGQNMSGGQKQRLSIARAVVRQPEIYLFDDSFSALDYKTDRLLRKALKKKTNGATSIIVAQRIGTIKKADKILVVDNGQIVGQGTHDELMTNCPVYQEIAHSQLSQEELANA